MRGYYLNENGKTLKTNCPPKKTWKRITEEEYNKTCKRENDAADELLTQKKDEMKPIIERRKLILQRAMENAEAELIQEGIIDEEQEPETWEDIEDEDSGRIAERLNEISRRG